MAMKTIKFDDLKVRNFSRNPPNTGNFHLYLYNRTTMQYIHTMRILVDASAILSVLLNEASKGKIVAKTKDAKLIAPSSMHWEIGNAISSLIKRKKISATEGVQVVEEYLRIPIQYVDVDLKEAVSVAGKYSMYAYDAYMIEGAKRYRIPLLSLDSGLNEVAKKEKIRLVEV